LAYCTAPLVLLGLLLLLLSAGGLNLLLLRLLAIGGTTGFSVRVAAGCVGQLVEQGKFLLVGYPIGVLYLLLGMLLFAV
jgi:hypothetical protein